MTNVINVRKAELKKNKYTDFTEWNSFEHTIYIGRNMSFYVPGTTKSKWANPFSVKKYGLEKCLLLYENYIRNAPSLYDQLYELDGKELGCWCHPKSCHGDILVKLLHEKYSSCDNDK